MTDRELMQQALEALENAEDQLAKPYSTDARQAIAALRERLAREEYPEGDVVGPCICGSWPGGKCLKCPRIEPAREEQPYANKAAYIESATNGRVRIDPVTGAVSIGTRQEQCAHGIDRRDCGWCCPARQEPVAWMQEMPTTENEARAVRLTTVEALARQEWQNPIPLYTAPQPREWVGLTDEEIGNFVSAVWPREATPADYIRAIEAKLREKNGGCAAAALNLADKSVQRRLLTQWGYAEELERLRNRCADLEAGIRQVGAALREAME